MRYIQLSNDSYILHFSVGLRTFTRTSFNFTKIRKLMLEGTTNEEDILPLLEIPPLPNGTYEAYVTQNNSMIYLHTPPTGTQRIISLLSDKILPLDILNDTTVQFVGIYASLKGLMDDWPEYLL